MDGGLLCLGDLGVARDEAGVVVGPFRGLPALQSSTSCHTCIHSHVWANLVGKNHHGTAESIYASENYQLVLVNADLAAN